MVISKTIGYTNKANYRNPRQQQKILCNYPVTFKFSGELVVVQNLNLELLAYVK